MKVSARAEGRSSAGATDEMAQRRRRRRRGRSATSSRARHAPGTMSARASALSSQWTRNAGESRNVGRSTQSAGHAAQQAVVLSAELSRCVRNWVLHGRPGVSAVLLRCRPPSAHVSRNNWPRPCHPVLRAQPFARAALRPCSDRAQPFSRPPRATPRSPRPHAHALLSVSGSRAPSLLPPSPPTSSPPPSSSTAAILAAASAFLPPPSSPCRLLPLLAVAAVSSVSSIASIAASTVPDTTASIVAVAAALEQSASAAIAGEPALPSLEPSPHLSSSPCLHPNVPLSRPCRLSRPNSTHSYTYLLYSSTYLLH